MKRLAIAISEKVAAHVRASVSGLQKDAELRLVFNGPPPGLLGQVFEHLAGDGAIEATLATGEPVEIPVLMQVDRLPPGHQEPEIGQSGTCSADYLMILRNSPACRIFIALVPPAQHTNLSKLSTRTDFGLSTHANSGAAGISEWIGDRFVQELIHGALARHAWRSEAGREEARRQVEAAIRAADEVDNHDANRPKAWAVLSRAWSVEDGSQSFGRMISLACGFPPCTDGEVDHDLQASVLEDLASHIEDSGFHSGIEGLKARASTEEVEALDQLLGHLLHSCEVPTVFGRSPSYFYGPYSALDEVGALPGWYVTLSAECIQRLLEEDSPRRGAILVECTNPIASQAKGLVPVVSQAPKLLITLPGDVSSARVSVQRDVGGKANHAEWVVDVEGTAEIVDDCPPSHKTPIRYSVTPLDKGQKEMLRGGSCRVVVLERWEPGFVVAARTSSKTSLPKPPKSRREKIAFECAMSLTGVGRHYVDVYVRGGVAIIGDVLSSDESGSIDDASASPVMKVAESEYGFELDAIGESFVQFTLSRPESSKEEAARIFVACDQVSPETCGSEYERLIRQNRIRFEPRATTDVHVERQHRACDLQAWMLSKEAAGRSYHPFVLAPDYSLDWRKRDWSTAEDTILSRGKFLNDPRPPMQDMDPGKEFVQLRRELAERIRGEDEDGLLESSRLGEWSASDSGFASKVEAYVRAYGEWLDSAPIAASWCDVGLVTRVGSDGKTLLQEPEAIVLSPLHPVRLAWHVLAQRSMFLAQRKNPCPAASILDPDCVPDSLTLSLRTAAGGYKPVTFFSVDCSSDYWSVLWNADKLDDIARRAAEPPLDREFGVVVGGISSGFSSSQVGRALGDVQSMLSAKPILTVSISSAAGQNNACNDGIMGWARRQLSVDSDGRANIATAGLKALQVLDEREPSSRPEDAQVANLAEDTASAVKWYLGTESQAVPDLGIIAQLRSSNPSKEKTSISSPISVGGLIRSRVREQLRAAHGAFICESRVGVSGPPSGDGLADKTALAITRLENAGDERQGYTFAPDVQSIEAALKRAEFAAVSSSAVDPACFLGGWLENSYLWDYDLPEYSNRAGDSNGYYLLSRIRDLDRDALGVALSRLGGNKALPDEAVDQVLLEVARRGIPTVRGLSGGDAGACGAVGVFVASRLLQDAFRTSGARGGLLPVWTETDQCAQVALVIPVDPFQKFLDDLTRAVKKDGMQRPDLLVVGLYISDSRVKCKLTPVEVKFRNSSGILPPGNCVAALQQNHSLSNLLVELSKRSDEPEMVLWKVAFQHLLSMLVAFGFRVYSQQSSVSKLSRRWAEHHSRVIKAIFSEEIDLDIDQAGRLIVIDGSTTSASRDFDGDEFKESIVLTHADARVVLGDSPGTVYDPIRKHVGNWNLMPSGVAAISNVADVAADIEDAGTKGQEAQPKDGVAEARGAPYVVDSPKGDAIVESKPGTPDEDAGTSSAQGPVGAPTASVGDIGVRLLVGKALDGFTEEDYYLALSDTSLNHLNCGVVGDLGTGKTQLLKSLVFQLARSTSSNEGVAPNVLIFDYKKDYISTDFADAVGAKVVKPKKLPLNVFDVSGSTESAAPWLDRFRFFADVLDKIYSGIGPVQRSAFKNAVKAAYETCEEAGKAPTIYDVHDSYRRQMNGKSDSILAIIDDLVDMEIFSASPGGAGSFDDFANGIVVIDLASLGQDDHTKNMLVAIMLNLFYEHMLRIKKRPYVGDAKKRRVIDSFLLVDEADNIMRYEFDVLRKVLLQGREFGVGVILASQYLKHFKAGGTDYRDPLLSWFIHKVPNITGQELAALGLTSNVSQLAERIKTLGLHECLYKTVGIDGEIVKGKPFFELLKGAVAG